MSRKGSRRPHTEEEKLHIREALSRPEVKAKYQLRIGRPHVSKEGREKLRRVNTGKKLSSETIQKMMVASKKNAEILWSSEGHREKQLQRMRLGSSSAKKTRPEKKLQEILETFPGFQFTGDGTKFIAGKNPDFVDEEHKLIIELFGDYWHSQEVTGVPEDQHVQERIEYFKAAGYQTLVVWEHELEDEEKIRMKVREIRNNSAGAIQLVSEDGSVRDLRPGCSISDVEVNESALKQLRTQGASVTMDLSEVKGLLD